MIIKVSCRWLGGVSSYMLSNSSLKYTCFLSCCRVTFVPLPVPLSFSFHYFHSHASFSNKLICSYPALQCACWLTWDLVVTVLPRRTKPVLVNRCQLSDSLLLWLGRKQTLVTTARLWAPDWTLSSHFKTYWFTLTLCATCSAFLFGISSTSLLCFKYNAHVWAGHALQVGFIYYCVLSVVWNYCNRFISDGWCFFLKIFLKISSTGCANVHY